MYVGEFNINSILIVAIAFLFISSIVLKSFLTQIKGYIGELRIRKLIGSLGQEYVVLNDLYVPKKTGELTQLDHVLLSPYGIFVIETKNYSGWIFGNETARNWTQTIYNKKSRFYNPIMQNNTHVKALQNYLDVDIPMHSIIVFSNAATFKFKEQFQQAKVIQNRQLKKTILLYKTRQISDAQLSYIAQLLDSLRTKTKEQKAAIKKEHMKHVRNVASRRGRKKVVGRNDKGTGRVVKAVESNNISKTDGIVMKEDITVGSVGNGMNVDRVNERAGAANDLRLGEERIAGSIEDNDTPDVKKTCPKCNRDLVLRKGKHGEFYGCSGFPGCRFTERVRGK